MALVTTALSSFTDETGDIVTKAILAGKTIQSGVRKEPGIKSSRNINTLTSTLYAVAATSCGWSNSGSTTLGKVNLAVCPIKVDESICIDTLESLYTQHLLSPGSYNQDLGGFQSSFVDEKTNAITGLIEEMIWQSSTGAYTTRGTGNMSLCDGLVAKLRGSLYNGQTVTASTASAMTTTNAIAYIDNMVLAIPTAVISQPDLTVFMSTQNFRTLMMAYRIANYYNYAPGMLDETLEFYHPGTNIKIKGVPGLDNTNFKNYMFLTPASNIVVGFDSEADWAQFELWFSKDNQEERFHARFKIGVDVIFAGFVVAVV